MSAKDLSMLGVLFTDRRDFYISPNEVRELWTDVAPFTTIVSNRGTRKVGDPDFKLFEHRSGWIQQEFSLNDNTPPAWNSNGEASDTTAENLTVDGIVGLPAVDSSWRNLLCEVYASDKSTYKGIVLITDVSAGKLVIKSMGNPRAANERCAALADNDYFSVIGNAHGTGTTAPEAFSDELQVVYNSTEIFKTSVEIEGTLLEAALRGYSSELERLRLEKNKEHKMQKERSFLFGTRVGGTGMGAGDSHQNAHVTDKDGKLVRTTMGIIPAIYKYGKAGENIFTIDADYNYGKFVDDTEKVFQYLPDDGTKYAFCGAGALSYWSKVDGATGFVAKSGFTVQLQTTQRDSLGFNFRTLETPHGIIKLVYAPALRGPYRKTMLVVDPSDLQFVQYRAPKFMANIKTEDAYDGVKDMYFSDEGIGLTLIEKHTLFNITA